MRRVDAACIVCNLAEVPTFAIDVDGLAVHAVLGQRQAVKHGAHGLHVCQHVVAHEVEAEAVYLVVCGPHAHRVEHQLAHHCVLGGRVLAAGARLDDTVRIEAVIVAGHDLVQNRLHILPRGVGVIEDNVIDNAQAYLVERLHHLPILEDALPALGICAVRALGCEEVEGVVAPVVGVHILRHHHGGLLLFTVGGHGGKLRRIG